MTRAPDGEVAGRPSRLASLTPQDAAGP